MCASNANDDGSDWPLTHRHSSHSSQQHAHQDVQYSAPNVGEQHLILWTRKYSEEEEDKKLIKRMEKHLLPISGSKICALSSAQTERHNVTSWWPVAFTGVMAGSTAKWSKQFNKWGTHKESNREYPHLNSTIPSSKACSSITRLRSWLPKSTGSGSWPDSGTRRRVMTACFRLLERLTSASVDTSPASDKQKPSLAAPGKESSYSWSHICQNTAYWCYKLDGISMGAPVEAPVPSPQDVKRPTTNPVLELHGPPYSVSWGRSPSSPEDSNTKTQSPMMPSSWRGARCILAYGEYRWPLYYSSKQS